jgi:hypothetical protein
MTDPTRKDDHVRVLSDLSGRVVGALLDESATARDEDAFADAGRRLREEGPPPLAAPWRAALTGGAGLGVRVATIVRHLTRDLLDQVTKDHHGDAAESAAEPTPANVRQIGDAREVPALEQASDGTWRPSGSSLPSQDELDAGARRRANVPALRSRYPELEPSDRLVLPPPPRER